MTKAGLTISHWSARLGGAYLDYEAKVSVP